MTTQNNLVTNQDDQNSVQPNDSKQELMSISEERNRLVRSVMQQPTEVLRDIATLAIGWVMHELEVEEHQHRPLDFVSWGYRYRIIGLADGEYGSGMMVSRTDKGPQMFDTSTCTLVNQLRNAQIGDGQ